MLLYLSLTVCLVRCPASISAEKVIPFKRNYCDMAPKERIAAFIVADHGRRVNAQYFGCLIFSKFKVETSLTFLYSGSVSPKMRSYTIE